VRHSLIYIATFLGLTFLIKCTTPVWVDENAEQTALNLANSIDSNSVNLLKEYSYGRRGNHDFWQKLSADTTLYSCSYKVNHDTIELNVFRPLNFVNDFASTFAFDTSVYYQYIFFQQHDTIVKLLRVDNHGQNHLSDTLVLTKHLFPSRDPFIKFAELTALKDRLGFIGTSYRSDIGDFIEFWITSQYKLTYLPDTLNMNAKFKKYWLDEFAKGKKIKEHWSLQKVCD
jgi:hypothetical protein